MQSPPLHDQSASPGRSRPPTATAGPRLSLAQLAQITGGQLALSSLPPLDGCHEPLGRITVDSGSVQPGDVFWALSANAEVAEPCALEAFVREAQGTVSASRQVAPWAGGFSMQVPAPRQALLQVGDWLRHQFAGQVLATVDRPGLNLTAHFAHQLLGTLLRGRLDRSGTACDLAIRMQHWTAELDYVTVELGAQHHGKIFSISHLCSPDIIAINSLQNLTHHSLMRDRKALAVAHARFLETLPRHAIVILNGHDPYAEEVARSSSLRTLITGRDRIADVAARGASYRDGKLAFHVDGVPFEFPSRSRRELPHLLAAIAMGRCLSIPLDALAAAARAITPACGHCDRRPL